MKPRVAIWGASGHGMVVADIVRLGGTHEIACFLDDAEGLRGADFCGAKVLGGREVLPELLEDGVDQIIIGVGDCKARLSVAEFVKEKGFGFPAAVHPGATVAGDVVIGPGTVVAAGAVINPASRVGAHVIINTCASVDHECVIADGAHICPGVRLAGRVSVGRATWVGIGAVVVGGVNIGAAACVGAGAVVVRDIADGVLAYGVPAREVRRMPLTS